MVIFGLLITVLALVLSTPELEEIAMPSWLLEPLGRQLPFDIPN